MKDLSRTNQELIEEISLLKQRIQELEQSEPERKRAEEALRESEDKFRSLVERSNVSVYLIQDGVFRYSNACFAEMLGYTVEEMIDKITPEDIVFPEDYRSFSAENIRKRLAGEVESIRYEVRLVTKNGEIRYVEAHGSRTAYQGRPAVIGTIVDITDRKHAEETLYESEQQYKTVFKNTGAATVIIEADTIISLCNAEFERLSGYTRNEIEGKKSWTEFVVREDLERMVTQHRMRRENHDQALQRYEFRFVPRTGEIRNIYLVIDTIYGTEKSVASLIDITDRKQAEEELRESEDKYRTLIETTDTGFVIIDKDGLVLDANLEYVRLTGHHDLSEIVGRSVIEWTADYEKGKNAAAIKTAFEKGYIRNLEVDYVDSKGNITPIEINATSMEIEGKIQTITICRDITDRKRVDEALRESESKFRALAENSPAVIFVIQGEKYIYTNPAFTAITGYTPEDLSSMNFWDLISPDMRELVMTRGIARQKMEDIPPRYDLKFITKSGEERYGNFSAAFIEFQHRPAILGSVLDITERKRMEEALKDSEEKYRNIFENAVEGIYQSTPGGRFISVNPAMARMCGYTSPEDMITKITDIAQQHYVNPQEREIFKEIMTRHGTSDNFEHQIYCKDGILIWVSTNSRVVRDTEGAILYYEGTYENITERRLADKQLRSERETFFSILHNAPYGIFVNDPNGGLLLVNSEASNITGYAKEDIPTGKVLFNKMYPDPEYRKNIIRTWIKDVSTKSIDRTFSVHCKDGAVKDLEFRTFRLPDGKAVTMFSDITDRKRAEEEKRNLQSQLIQSQKMEAVGTLAGGIAHDFNNILTALMGYATLMQMKMDKENPLRPYVDQILSASQKAADLTQSLLAFSRQQPVTLVPLDINNTIKVTKKLLKRVLTEDIELRTSLTHDDTIVMADKSQMDQILFNLVANARDAMPKGGKLTIETSIATVDNTFIVMHGFGEPGRYVLINVSDTGMGMDEATKEKIFDPFFTTKEVGKGTGLGLATVYGIVKQHNGYITVDSTPNQGSTFRIYLPAVKMMVDETQDMTTPVTKGKEIILIAEDNEEVRRFMREALQQYGYTIIEASDGEDAVDKFKQHRDIDLIVVDSVMPKKNGREVYEEIRGINPHIKVLFMSGYTKDVVLNKGIEDKEFDFIAKPLSLNRLLQKVREVLDR
ncbi:MAG: PAS domain S-box protein [Proteobacteria bacterium]|nr:PAS domain S-box protein [Pseudomonadota bacterium]